MPGRHCSACHMVSIYMLLAKQNLCIIQTLQDLFLTVLRALLVRKHGYFALAGPAVMSLHPYFSVARKGWHFCQSCQSFHSFSKTEQSKQYRTAVQLPKLVQSFTQLMSPGLSKAATTNGQPRHSSHKVCASKYRRRLRHCHCENQSLSCCGL